NHRRAQLSSRELEADTRPRRRLVEGKAHRVSAQSARGFIQLSIGALLPQLSRLVEDGLQLRARELVDVEQMSPLPGSGASSHRSHRAELRAIRTSSTPSVSDRRTCTFSSRLVGRFLPTWS